MQENIGIVPARSGSQRIKNKNIREFLGKPIILYALEAMQNSLLFDRIIVSTDSVAIADVAKSIGAEVPFFRPSNLSGSDVNTIDVVHHAINEICVSPGDRICCVYATNPFLTPDLISLGLNLLLEDGEIDYVTPVVRYGFPIQRSLVFRDGALTMANPQFMYTHSQNLEASYHETAQFWWGYADRWLEKAPMQGRLLGICVPSWSQQDIDTEEDWLEAELKFESLIAKGWPLSFDKMNYKVLR